MIPTVSAYHVANESRIWERYFEECAKWEYQNLSGFVIAYNQRILLLDMRRKCKGFIKHKGVLPSK